MLMGRIIYICCHTLSTREQQYGNTELETLAVAQSLKHFRAYLYEKASISFIDGKHSAKEAAVVLHFHLQHFLIRLAF